MGQSKHLIYIDILGFESLSKKIEKKSGRMSKHVRKDLYNTIKTKIEELKRKNMLMYVSPGRDDWLISIENDKTEVFSIIYEILNHNTGYLDNKSVPLEIAIGTVEYDDWATLEGNEIIFEDETIEYLKTDILKKYRGLYKEIYGKSIKETFIIGTPSFYDELTIHEQKLSKKIFTQGNFLLPKSIIVREKKISDFFKEIGQERNDLSGALIDRVFVPPVGYEKIEENLIRDRIVFVTGTVGYGKTYTAIRLLWNYFNQGYTPCWITGKDEYERRSLRDKLANIDQHLKPGHVLYFEDPFGVLKYERRDDLKERIDHILSGVENSENVYVIITSRKDIFEDFSKESYSAVEIENFELNLNLLQPAYNLEKRQKLLEQWAIEKNCEWLEIIEIKDFILESMENKLINPLSIYGFVKATINTTDLKEIKIKIIKYTEKLSESFADEINGLYESGHEDRILFLSFIYILGYVTIEFVQKQYNMLKKNHYEEFGDILEKEYRVKKEGSFNTKNYLTFAHPLYSESIKYLIKYSGCKNMFSKVLIQLSEIDSETVISDVAWFITNHYNDLPNSARKLIFDISDPSPQKKDIDIGDIADAIMYNYTKLPKEVGDLVFKLAKRDSLRISMCNNIDKLPKTEQIKLKTYFK